MTNDTNYRGKANAVFFAAIMVVSMFAAGFAAAPAAATADGVNLSPATVDLNDADTTTDIEVTTDSTTDAVEYSYAIVNGSDDVVLSGDNNASDNSGYTFSGVDVGSLETGEYTVYANNSASETAPTEGDAVPADYGQAQATLTIEDSTPSLTADAQPGEQGSANDYTFTADLSQVDDSTDIQSVVVDFDTGDSSSVDTTGITADQVSVQGDDTGTPGVDSVAQTTGDAARITMADSFTLGSESGDLTFTIEDVNSPSTGTFNAQLDFEDGSQSSVQLTEEGEYEIVERADYSGDADFDRQISDGATVYQGQDILVDVSSIPDYDGGNLELRRVGDEQTVGGSPVALDPENGYVAVSTEDRDADQWVITTKSRGTDIDNDDIQFEIVSQDLSAEFDDNTVGDVGEDALVDYEISSDARNVYATNVEVDGLDDEELTNIFTDSNDATFSDDVTSDIDGSADDGEYDRYNVTEWARNNADAGDYAVNTEDEYITLFRSEGTHELNFTDIDADDYEFNASVVDSTGEDTDTVTVQDVGDGEVNIEDSSLNQQQGDIVEFNVTADGSASSGTVVIGDEADFGYQANVSITDFGDDDQITLAFNTYAAADGNADTDAVTIVDADDDDNINVEEYPNSLDNILATGDYDVSSSASNDAADTLENSDDVATLFIEERSTEGIQLWTASDSNAGDVLDADEDEQLETLTGAVEDDLITQTDTVAHNDVSIHQISASGLTGALAAAGDIDGTDDESEQLAYLINNVDNDNYDGQALDLRIRETRESAGPNADRSTVDIDSNDFDVLVDEENDEYYLVLDTSSITVDNGDTLDNAEDYEFDVEFTVTSERLLDPEDDVDQDEFEDELQQEVTTPFAIAERTAEFDQDPYNVSNAEGQTVTGTSNVAPGTEFSVRARSDSGTQPSFVKTTDEVTVGADGSWSADFDFSNQAVGDEYTLSIQQLGLNDAVEADGTVVEQVQEPATFEVSDLSPQEATATAGDSVTVSATIENTGGQEGTQSVALTLDGDELDSQEVTLADGNSTTVEFTADTSGLEAGDYTHGVATDDDEATGTLTIEASDDSSGDDSSGDDSSGDDSSGDDSSGDDSSGDSSGDSEGDSTDDGTPGFGALVALVALIAAALLATRRND